MNIRGKPKLDADAFIEAAAETAPTKSKATARGERTAKHFLISKDLLFELKERALKESREQGRRVTETALLEQALMAYLGKKS